MQNLVRHPVALALLAIAALLLIGSTIAIVPETKQGVIVRFGDPKKIINRYRPNEDFGKTGAGIILRWPFIDQIVWIDKRVLSVEMERQQVLSSSGFRSTPSPVTASSTRCACISRQAARSGCRTPCARYWAPRCATSWASAPSRRCSPPNAAR